MSVKRLSVRQYKSTSGELALCANYPSSIFPVSPAAPEMAS